MDFLGWMKLRGSQKSGKNVRKIDHRQKLVAKRFDLVSKENMCKILMVTLLLAFTSCTQVVTLPVRTLLDMPSKVERVRTSSTHDLTSDPETPSTPNFD
jgi:hypothetical protein